jgi:hypothetical protein
LLTLLWFVAAIAALTAMGAVMRARRLARRLDRLSESYWELRYEFGQLSARLSRIEDPEGAQDAQARTAREAAATFVPLSSLKR